MSVCQPASQTSDATPLYEMCASLPAEPTVNGDVSARDFEITSRDRKSGIADDVTAKTFDAFGVGISLNGRGRGST